MPTATARTETPSGSHSEGARTHAAGRSATSPTLAAVVLVLAGLALAAYPLLRGFAVEDGLTAAELYARPAWLWAHALGMAGFVFVAWGLAAIDASAHRAALVGALLLLPYYGAEAYGLHALGRRVLETGDVAMTARGDGAADLFRYEPVAMITFAFGWLALIVVAGRLVVLARRSRGTGGSAIRVAGYAVTAVAYATYLPQFFAPGGVRIAHGLLAALGLGLVAFALWTTRGIPREEP